MSHEPSHRAGPPVVPPQRTTGDDDGVDQESYVERFVAGDLTAILAPYHR